MPSPLHRDAPLQIPMFIERVARRFVVAILLAAAVAACGRRDASPPDEADDFVPPGVASEALSARDCPWGLGLCPWPGLKSTAAGKGFRVGIWSEVSGKTVTWGRGEVLTKFIMQGSAFPKAVTFSAYAAPAQAGILRVEVLSDAPTVSARRVLARGRTMVRNVPTAGYAEFTVALHTVAPLTRLADAEAYWLSVWVEGSKGPAGFWLDEATSTAPGVVTQACAKKGPSVSADCKSFVAEATRQLAFIPVFEAAASPSCEDRLRNGDEPSRDCGVVCNRGCGLRSRCYEDRDCSSSGVCRPAGVGPGQSDATCSPSLGDSQQVCACTVKSELGQPCQSDGDCNASVCQGYSGAASVSPICVPKTCRDGKLSPGELDVDCGGPCAALCKLGQSCKVRGDCDRGLLCGGDTALTCVVPRSEGATCSRDWQCTTGACVARKCRPLGAAGAACDTKNDCDSRVCRNLSCAAPTYADRVRNGAETDTDCGGTGPGRKACIGGARCVVTSDCDLTKGLACGTDGLCGLPLAAPCTKNDACLSRLCGKASTALTDTRQVCLTAYPAGDARHCANGLTDADETDLNCGGSVCPGCAATRKCVGNGDCASDVCSLTGSCAAPACTDGVRNGTETAVDCGGACAKCAAGVPATRASDCASGVLGDEGVCISPTCFDGVKNGGESAVDCGGPCLKCKPTQDCGADTDCDSGRCDLTKKICADPTDLDKMRNGTETDIDCGGKASKRCALRKGCLVSGDCIDGAVCSAGFCAPATCANGVKDVTDPAVTNRETDLDCGGRVCGPCVSGRACAANTDCRSGVCTQQKVCAAPSATDNLQNGDETAKNCGGASGVGCAYGLPCRVDGDCALDMVCTAGICGYGECANSTKTGAARSCGRMCASHCDDGGACRASVDCKAGAVCLAGADERKTCTTRNCTLNGVDYRPGALNPENGCQACDPETNTWRPRGVGDACDDGKAGTTDDHCEVRYQTLVCVGTSFTCAAPATATCMAANVPVADGAPCDEDTDCADPVAVGQKLCVGGRCTGASCRAAPKPAGTVCGAVSGPCFSGGVCDGASLDCPVGDWLTGIECRAPAGPCDAPELCLNGLAACPSDRPRPVGDTCGTEKGDGFCVVSSGALQCLPCGVGQAFDAANGDCAACPAGQTSEGGASPCAAVNCAAGQYWNGTACALCAVGTSTAGGTVFACTSCTVTEKWNGVTRLCEPCPAGQRSNGGPSTGCTAITCAKDNYWTGTQCAPCPTGGRSTGGAVTGCTFTDVTAPVDATTGLVVTGGVGTLSLDWTTAQATDDVGVVKYRVAVSADASAPANCAAGTDVVGTRWTTPATLVGGRTYGLRLCALDAKGNVSRGLTGSGTPNDLCPKANNGGCSIHATCANVAGGRTCTCPATSVTTDMGRSCIPPPLVSPPTDRTIGGAMFTFVTLPPGVFRMGSVTGAGADGYDPEAGGREAPAHVVTLTKPTIMARTETTQVQWTALMKVNAAWFRTASDAASRPVESVSWNDAVAFCNALSTADGLPAAYVGHARVAGSTGYRLPTEAEWEYAARATTTTPRHEQLDEAAWHAGNSVFAGVAQTHAVGGKVRNAFELFDMLGNVAEWTGDWYAPYGLDAQTDPAGPATGKARVYRGGSWGFVGGEARAAFRGNVFQPSQRSYLVGFRVARTPSP